jgi:2'-5' RNA ligase
MDRGRGLPQRGGRPFVRPVDDPPGTSRLFVALPVAEDVRTALGELMSAVAGGSIEERRFGQPRWVRVDGLHVTLRFLGATVDEKQGVLGEALADAARGVEPFRVTLNGAGSFPNPIHPRVLWIGIAQGEEPIAELVRRLEPELLPLGWPPENRPFSPHLTLARTDGVPGAAERARHLEELARDVELSWSVDRMVLYKSLIGRGPTRYEALSEAKLTRP